MIKSIAEKPRREKIEIDLTGPEGNAHFLCGVAKQIARQIGKDPEPIIRKMLAGDYDRLVKTFDEAFGEHVILYREEKALEVAGG